MRHEVHLQKPRAGIVPIRERPDGNLPARLRGPFPLAALTRRGADRRQEPVDGRRANCEQMLTYQRVERQMAVSFHRRDQVRQDRFEAFPTDAIRGLPKDNDCLADRPRIDPPSQSGRLGDDGLGPGDKSDRMLAMAAGDGNEFIQYF